MFWGHKFRAGPQKPNVSGGSRLKVGGITLTGGMVARAVWVVLGRPNYGDLVLLTAPRRQSRRSGALAVRKSHAASTPGRRNRAMPAS